MSIFKILSIAILLCNTFQFAFAQESPKIAPYMLINWELDGSSNCSDYRFTEPSPVEKGFGTSIMFASENKEFWGDRAKQISWTMKFIQYAGWGIDLKFGDEGGSFSLTPYSVLTFKIQCINGNEEFRIQIKDKDGTIAGFSSSDFVAPSKAPQEIKIPLNYFKGAIDWTQIVDFNFRFDDSNASKKGTIIIDEFMLK